MKKIGFFLVFSLIIACKNSPKNGSAVSLEMKKAMPSSEAAAYDFAADSVQPTLTKDKMATKAASSKTATKKSEPESAADEATTQPNVFFMPQYKTTSRKIIRTAQVKTKVEDTEKATYQIEQMARKWRGFVVTNNYENHLEKQEEVQISEDSILQITHLEAVNNLCVRVPNQNLDTFLMEISRIYKHLDFRHVNANDLTASFLTNQLKAEARNQSSQRIATASNEKGKRLNDIVAAEESRVQLSDEAIEQKVQNVETDYDIAYSIVNIQIYDDVVVSKNIVPSQSPAIANVGFGFRCQKAFTNGWMLLLDIFVGILNLWVFIVIGILGYIMYRRTGSLYFSKLSLSRKE